MIEKASYAPEQSAQTRKPAKTQWRFVLLVTAVLIAGAFVHRPSLSLGYLADDYLQNAMLDGEYPVPRSALDLYSFIKPGELARIMDAGTVPWWSHPDFTLQALRPLSSALLWMDHRLLGLSAYAQHVHSLLWWALVVIAFSVFCRELLSPRIAALAIVLFGLDPAHVVPIAWIANRAALVSTFFGLLGLIYYVRFRRRGGAGAAALAAAGFALALAGGEYGLCVLAYAFTYELFVATDPLRGRLKAWLPAALPALVYVSVYVILGFGPTATAAYVSPLSAPRAYISQAVVRLPALLASELLMFPPEFVFTVVLHEMRLVLWLVPPLFVMGLLFLGTIRRAGTEEARMLRWLGAGMLLAMLPLIGTIPDTRLLLIPSIGGSVLIAALFADVASRFLQRAELRRPLFWARALATTLLFLFHVVLVAPASATTSARVRDANQLARNAFAQVEIDDRIVARQDLIVINAPDPLTLLYVPQVRKEQELSTPRVWRGLSMTPHPVRVQRVAADTLELSVAQGSLTDMPIATLVRPLDLGLLPGEIISLERLSIQVFAVGPTGPQRVRFKFSESLDSDSVGLLVLSGGRLVRMAKLPVGGELATEGLLPPQLPGM